MYENADIERRENMAALETDTPKQFDTRAFRDVLGSFATGVTVITTMGDDDRPLGLVVNSFSSVSLEPPLILWSIGLGTPSHTAFIKSGRFAVNVMGANAKDETMQFARPSEDKFSGVDWSNGQTGVPLLNNALATLECKTHQTIECGDHEIIIGRVLHFGLSDGKPLVFHRGKFAGIGTNI